MSSGTLNLDPVSRLYVPVYLYVFCSPPRRRGSVPRRRSRSPRRRRYSRSSSSEWRFDSATPCQWSDWSSVFVIVTQQHLTVYYISWRFLCLEMSVLHYILHMLMFCHLILTVALSLGFSGINSCHEDHMSVSFAWLLTWAVKFEYLVVNFMVLSAVWIKSELVDSCCFVCHSSIMVQLIVWKDSCPE